MFKLKNLVLEFLYNSNNVFSQQGMWMYMHRNKSIKYVYVFIHINLSLNLTMWILSKIFNLRLDIFRFFYNFILNWY